ncbi:2-dehydropantoate 2-reductase [Saitoella complicata NRRL Y-17804]|nr:2-dehydropantoate 2-reductase [Saitoella complicata NRRL Y-17804]ODQ53713.1 2-dehydropantoate 2-reductase [Saitoella complicata NRRL Y-17804]
MEEVLTLGLGGVGAVYSLALDLSKQARITTVCRSNYQVVKDNGLTIHSDSFGKFEPWRPHKVVSSTSSPEATETEYSYILVTTKALPEATPSTADILRPVVSKNTTIVLLQNGVGIEDPISAAFPENPIISCSVYLSSSQFSSGVITQTALERVVIGGFDNGVVNSMLLKNRVARFAELLRVSGANVAVNDDIQMERWKKLLWNASYNTYCTVTMMDTLTFCETVPNATELIRTCMNEVLAVSNALGHSIPPETVENLIKFTMGNGKYKPSMLLDRERGSQMEVEVLLGNPTRIAKEHGVPTPILNSLYGILSAENWKLRQG